MLNKIIHFSLHNRIVVLIAAMLLLIGGTYTAIHTEVDVFPDLTAPTVVVMTEAGGLAAEEVEQLVTFPIETAVNGATHVRRVRSSSTHSFSVVWVEFDWDTDIYLARQIVSEKLAIVSEKLPAGVGKPTLGPQSSILGEMLIVGLTADSTSMLDLRTLADWTIRPRLLSTGGVAQVSVLGGDIKEYQIQLDPERMRHYGVTLADVLGATRGMNLNANGGVLYEYGNEYIVRGLLSTTQAQELGRAVVKVDKGQGNETTSPASSSTPIYLDQHPGADRQTGSGIEGPEEKPAARRACQHRHLPPEPLHRKLHRQCAEVAHRGWYLRCHRALPLPGQCQDYPYLSGHPSAVADSGHRGATLHGTDHQHHEPWWSGHRHRVAGG